MPSIDSITALGRLLRDGPLRDAYASQPAKTLQDLGVAETERAPLLNLNPQDLEAQAQVLLRKRFETLSRLIPRTCRNLGDSAWPLFTKYARGFWPGGDKDLNWSDPEQFLRFILRTKPEAVSPSENNRVTFASGRISWAIHWVSDIQFRNRPRNGLQIFLRTHAENWREYTLYFAL